MAIYELDPMQPYQWAIEERKKGIQELAGAKQNNPRIVWYHAFTTLKATTDEVPWCSSFMCAAAETCGYESTRSAAAKSWATYGEEGTGAVGEIAVFSRDGGNHVAFINSPYKKGDQYVEVLGGNQSNSVRVSKYDASRLIAIRKFPSGIYCDS